MAAIIGLVPLIDEERESYWMLPGYMDGITEAGGIPIMLPLTEDPRTIKQLTEMCDGILLTGGHDVSPERYGEEKIKACGACCPQRDAMESLLLREALAHELPVFGICRGIQFLNAALGGTLYQDIPLQRPSRLEHHQTPPYHIPSHEVSIYRESPLYELLQKDTLAVNSYHHQGIRRLADGLKAMASADDGLIEAVYMPDRKFVWAVQWHPEFSHLTDEDSRKIFSAFVSAAESFSEHTAKKR